MHRSRRRAELVNQVQVILPVQEVQEETVEEPVQLQTKRGVIQVQAFTRMVDSLWEGLGVVRPQMLQKLLSMEEKAVRIPEAVGSVEDRRVVFMLIEKVAAAADIRAEDTVHRMAQVLEAAEAARTTLQERIQEVQRIQVQDMSRFLTSACMRRHENICS